MVDWLPWHHTAGGNHNIGLILWNGGTLYIDEGKPTAAEIGRHPAQSARGRDYLLCQRAQGPRGTAPVFEADAELRERFFSRLRLMFYAGAHLAQHVWEALQRHALETTGERILMLTGLGATETAPFVFMPGREVSRAGEVGLPAPGIELKLVPLDEERFDVRLRGPNITPGYWRREELTTEAFDEEGFYRLGDALRFLDPAAPAKGFAFDGRIAEDFKLSTGTWVHVGVLRRSVIAHFAPLLRDAVIAGHDRDELTVLLVPDLKACRRLCGDLSATDGAGPEAEVMAEGDRELLRSASLRRRFQERLDSLAGSATGSSNHVARALLLDEPLSIDAHEVTDKGTINQRAVLTHRAALVEELYIRPHSPRVLVAER